MVPNNGTQDVLENLEDKKEAVKVRNSSTIIDENKPYSHVLNKDQLLFLIDYVQTLMDEKLNQLDEYLETQGKWIDKP